MTPTALKITFLNIPRSESVEGEIRRRVHKLRHFFENLLRCQVTVDKVAKHKSHGQLYEVRIDLSVPGSEIAIGKSHGNEDVYAAIATAFEAAARRLQGVAA